MLPLPPFIIYAALPSRPLQHMFCMISLVCVLVLILIKFLLNWTNSYHFQVSLRRRKREVLVEEIVSQEEAQGLPSSELDAVENQLKWASWELHSLRHCGEDRNSVWAGEWECGSFVQNSAYFYWEQGGRIITFTWLLRHRHIVGFLFLCDNSWFANLESFILQHNIINLFFAFMSFFEGLPISGGHLTYSEP